MIAVLPFRDRPNYLRITLASLKEALRTSPDTEVYIFNDASTVPYPDILKEISRSTIIKRNSAVGPYKSKSSAITEVFQKTKTSVVITLDSDCLIHPGAFRAASEMLANLPDMTVGTIFNSDRHKDHDPNFKLKKYVIKDDIGGLGVVIKRSTWEWYLKITKDKEELHEGWDWNLCLWIKKFKEKKIYSTIRSYIDHFGQIGSHSGPACPIDRAIRFME